ncbi:hypothetical protein VY88_06340 [Azospirillum thiophilum]|uniref:Uncharacterized protein n=1 Tax=Azospirillum thiophilum TaxID=528244 RepID=A0AAC8VWH7_9PROT|nr:hypothetical protein AL072_06370 [Azospirillum thiophilum]KJR65736.1 hypothetical protein VY88_06340 [Azospirillum thiophilum]
MKVRVTVFAAPLGELDQGTCNGSQLPNQTGHLGEILGGNMDGSATAGTLNVFGAGGGSHVHGEGAEPAGGGHLRRLM